jgi:hypothetical protein
VLNRPLLYDDPNGLAPMGLIESNKEYTVTINVVEPITKNKSKNIIYLFIPVSNKEITGIIYNNRKTKVINEILPPNFASLRNKARNRNLVLKIFRGKMANFKSFKKALGQGDTLAVIFIGHGYGLNQETRLLQFSDKRVGPSLKGATIESSYVCLLGCDTFKSRQFFNITNLREGQSLLTVDSMGNGTTLSNLAQGAFAFISKLIIGERNEFRLLEDFESGFRLSNPVVFKNGKMQDFKGRLSTNDINSSFSLDIGDKK